MSFLSSINIHNVVKIVVVKRTGKTESGNYATAEYKFYLENGHHIEVTAFSADPIPEGDK